MSDGKEQNSSRDDRTTGRGKVVLDSEVAPSDHTTIQTVTKDATALDPVVGQAS